MKTKIALLVLYFAFVGVAVSELRALRAVVADKERAIEGWQRLDARMKAGTTEIKKPVSYLQAYQTMAGEAIASSSRQQNIILIGLLLTAPLALYVAMPQKPKVIA